MKKQIKHIFIILLFAIVLWISPQLQVNAESSSSLSLNNLDFDVVVNADGSMDVTETWNIRIGYTNTLYKDFKLDKNKYTNIINVKVAETTDGIRKELTQIDEEMYHVTKNCYYGLKTSSDTFEIAWGVGLDKGYETRIYEISYTITDAIGKYNDYAELYWQFVGEDFEIDADKIMGTITLPQTVTNKEDIKVWGHNKALNGEIYVTDYDEIKFKLRDFSAGSYVEIRSLFPTNLITTSDRTYNKNIYDEVYKEEKRWADQANIRKQIAEIEEGIYTVFFISIILALCIIFIEKAFKYVKKMSSMQKFEPEQKLDYFRDLPEKNVTPGEALYVLKEPYNNFTYYFGKIFSAEMLNLNLKGYIELNVDKEEKNKEKIYIKKLKEADENLKSEERQILSFIIKAIKNKGEIEIKELEKFITNHASSVESLINTTKKLIENSLEKEKIIDKKQQEEYQSYKNFAWGYYLSAFVTVFWAFPLSIILFLDGILCSRIKKKTNSLTQKGVNLQEKWKGLKKYMEDFSLLDEKEVPAVEIWEQYLVYATAFGIADKVLKQLKTIYPNIDDIDGLNTSAYMHFMYHSNFSSSFSGAINSSISSAYTSSHSSSYGGGGGFSGGGGRRPADGGGGGGR